jgi:hypothetical protein
MSDNGFRNISTLRDVSDMRYCAVLNAPQLRRPACPASTVQNNVFFLHLQISLCDYENSVIAPCVCTISVSNEQQN